MNIMQFSKELTDEIMTIQHNYESRYPLAERFRTDDLKNPLLNKRRNILLAVQGDKVIGFSKFLARQNFTKKYFHRVWLDIKVLDGEDRDTMNSLLEASIPLIRDSTSNFFRAAGTRICVRTHQSETEMETFFADNGFSHIFDFIYMERDLNEEITDIPFPEGIHLRLWRPSKEPEMLEYLRAEQSCFQDSPLEYKYLHYFFHRPEWKRNGVLLTAFDKSDDIVGSVMMYPENEREYYTEEVFVMKKWRNMGIAKALMARALSYLKSRNAESALLSVTSDRTSALKIYTDSGYSTTLTRKVLAKTI